MLGKDDGFICLVTGCPMIPTPSRSSTIGGTCRVLCTSCCRCCICSCFISWIYVCVLMSTVAAQWCCSCCTVSIRAVVVCSAGPGVPMAAEVSQQDLRVAPENPGKRSRSGSCGAPRRRSVPVSAAHNRVVTHAFFAFVPAATREGGNGGVVIGGFPTVACALGVITVLIVCVQVVFCS